MQAGQSAPEESADQAVTDEVLDQAVQGGDIATLLAVLTQATGDTELLDRSREYINGPWDYTVEIPADLDLEIRTRLRETLRTQDVAAAAQPGLELIETIMGAIVGETVPPEYLKMVSKDLGYADAPRKASASSSATGTKVLVIGAGLSGICAAIRLREAGYSYEVLEKNQE